MKDLTTILVDDLQVIPTKSQVASATDKIVAIVENGEIDPLQALATITALADTFAAAKKRITEFAITEAEKYPQKTISAYGAQFQLKEAGIKYDYSMNPEWVSQKEEVDKQTEELKAIEAYLKAKGNFAKSATTTVSVILPK